MAYNKAREESEYEAIKKRLMRDYNVVTNLAA